LQIENKQVVTTLKFW